MTQNAANGIFLRRSCGIVWIFDFLVFVSIVITSVPIPALRVNEVVIMCFCCAVCRRAWWPVRAIVMHTVGILTSVLHTVAMPDDLFFSVLRAYIFLFALRAHPLHSVAVQLF